MPYQRGSGFVGLQQYLGANQEAAQRMGSQLAGQVEQQGLAAQSAIDARRQQVQQQIAAGTPQYVAPDYTGMSRDEAWDAQAARRSNLPSYTGPTDMGDVEALSQQAQAAEQQAQLGGTDAGRAVLLQQQAQGPYGLGARTLDALLAGRGAGGRLDAAASRFGDLQRYLGTAQQDTAARAAAGQQQAEGVGARIRAEPKVAMPPKPRGAGRTDPTNDLQPIERTDRRGLRPVRKGY